MERIIDYIIQIKVSILKTKLQNFVKNHICAQHERIKHQNQILGKRKKYVIKLCRSNNILLCE